MILFHDPYTTPTHLATLTIANQDVVSLLVVLWTIEMSWNVTSSSLFPTGRQQENLQKKPWDQWGKPPKQPHHPHHRKKRQVLSLRSNSMVFSIRLYKLMALYVLSTSVKTHWRPGGGSIWERARMILCFFFCGVFVVWGESTNIRMEYILRGLIFGWFFGHIFFIIVHSFRCVVSINIGWRVRKVEGKKHHLQSIVMILVVTIITEREAQATQYIQ